MNKLSIPKKISLAGHDIVIERAALVEDNTMGITDFMRDKIVVATETNMSEDNLVHTYFHELVHAILTVMGESKVSNNEVFVDLFSSFLHQALKTAEY